MILISILMIITLFEILIKTVDTAFILHFESGLITNVETTFSYRRTKEKFQNFNYFSSHDNELHDILALRNIARQT